MNLKLFIELYAIQSHMDSSSWALVSTLNKQNKNSGPKGQNRHGDGAKGQGNERSLFQQWS